VKKSVTVRRTLPGREVANCWSEDHLLSRQLPYRHETPLSLETISGSAMFTSLEQINRNLFLPFSHYQWPRPCLYCSILRPHFSTQFFRNPQLTHWKHMTSRHFLLPSTQNRIS